jgi:uncharacterized membrane protein
MVRFKSEYWVPAGLIALSFIPAVAGGARLASLAGATEVTPENIRFFAAPLPVILHVIGATAFCVIGAFQFVPALRRRPSRWHKLSGRALVPAGVVAALTGLWMAQFHDLPPEDGFVLYLERLIFGFAMLGSLVLGVVTVIRRDFSAHKAWMMRGYAIGLGAGTQAMLGLPVILLSGPPDQTVKAVYMGLAWALNLAFVEWRLRRGVPRRTALAAITP